MSYVEAQRTIARLSLHLVRCILCCRKFIMELTMTRFRVWSPTLDQLPFYQWLYFIVSWWGSSLSFLDYRNFLIRPDDSTLDLLCMKYEVCCNVPIHPITLLPILGKLRVVVSPTGIPFESSFGGYPQNFGVGLPIISCTVCIQFPGAWFHLSFRMATPYKIPR